MDWDQFHKESAARQAELDKRTPAEHASYLVAQNGADTAVLFACDMRDASTAGDPSILQWWIDVLAALQAGETRGYRVEYYQGGSWHEQYVPWSHFDAACQYLRRAGLALDDVSEVLVNFPEAELRDILAHPANWED